MIGPLLYGIGKWERGAAPRKTLFAIPPPQVVGDEGN
jgi:hypothetical protein